MITYLKSHSKALGFGLKRYEIDLLCEVLNIDFGQEAVKIFEVKVVSQKKHLPISPIQAHAPGVSQVGRCFFPTPALTSGIFADS